MDTGEARRRTADTDGAPGEGTDRRPTLTVIVPVLDGADVLPRSLAALEASGLENSLWNVVVVDDGSTDGSAELARARGHRVVSVPAGPQGPGAARNLGAAEASGDVLVFVDADVCVHADALERIRSVFLDHGDVAAVFGTYDTRPADPGFLSQYRNLYHRYVHLRGAGDAETFWAGCGAVRRRVFHDLGGFDVERFPRPQIEDIELGYRIRDAGWRILLDPGIQATHLKRWTLRGMLRTDLFDRGVPWMRLLLESPRRDALNVHLAERIRTGLVGLACALLLSGVLLGQARVLAAAVLPLAAAVLSNPALFRWFARVRGWGFALAVVPMNLLFHFVAGTSVVLALTGHFLEGRHRAGVTPGESRSTLQHPLDESVPSSEAPSAGARRGDGLAPSREPR